MVRRLWPKKIATSAARFQLKYKDPKRWLDFANQLRDKSGQGLSITIVRCQALRPSLHDLRDQLSAKTIPVLLIGAFEAKQAINNNQVEYAQAKVATVRRLHRTSLPIPHAGGTFPPKALIPFWADF